MSPNVFMSPLPLFERRTAVVRAKGIAIETYQRVNLKAVDVRLPRKGLNTFTESPMIRFLLEAQSPQALEVGELVIVVLVNGRRLADGGECSVHCRGHGSHTSTP